MDLNRLKDPKVFIKDNILPLSLGILGLILFAYGLIGLFSSNNSSEEIRFEANQQETPKAKKILVDIEGAVIKPGLYELPEDSRIQNLLVAAGGLSASADRDYISKNINLAVKLTDGGKVYIPQTGQETVNNSSLSSSGESESPSGLVNINTASQKDLEDLPGIGPVTAGKIISSRPFGSIDDLKAKKAVSNSVFEKIKDQISVY